MNAKNIKLMAGVVVACLTIVGVSPAQAVLEIPGSFHLTRINPDHTTVQLFQSTPGIITDNPMDVSITLRGPRIAVGINSITVVDIVDPNPRLYGGIGVGAIWESEARFDNVSVVGSSGTLFADIFDSRMSPEWVPINANPWVQDGWLHSRDLAEGLRDSYAAVHTNDSSWSDYTFHLTVQPIITDHTGTGMDLWQNALVQFRVTDWWNNGVSNMPVGYSIYMFGPSHGVPEPATLLLLGIGGLTLLRRKHGYGA